MHKLITALLFALVSITLMGCYTRLVPLSKKQHVALQQEARSLSEGTLIVRLYTNNPKRRTLVDYGQTEAIKTHDRDRREYAATLMSAWTDNYDFSPLLFIPDSLFNAFREGADIPLFLNQELQLDPSITLQTEAYYVLARGSRDYAFKWLNKDLEPIRPQPPINYDKLSMWELLQGRDKVLNERVKSTNQYFRRIASSPTN